MNNKCKGCEWYGKPYWSVINPCDNCQRDNIQEVTRLEDLIMQNLCIRNEELKERVAYLERSNDRREDEILSLRQELNDSNNKIDKAIEYIDKEWYWDGTGIDELEKILKGRRK